MSQHKEVTAGVAVILIGFGFGLCGCDLGSRRGLDGGSIRQANDSSLVQEQSPDAESSGLAAPLERDTLAEVDAFLERLAKYTPATTGQGPVPQEGQPIVSASGAPPSRASARPNAPLSTDDRPIGDAISVAGEGEGPGAGSDLQIPVLERVSIQSPDSLGDAPAPEDPAGTANSAVQLRTPPQTLSVDDYIELLRETGAELDPTEAHWRLQMFLLAMGRPVEPTSDDLHPASEAGDALDALLNVAREIRRVYRDPFARWDQALAQADELGNVVSEWADVQIPTVALCREVRSFGSYDPMSSEEFAAGRTHRTIVYCEVRNLRSERTTDGFYKTVVGMRLEVLDKATGRSWWQREEPEIIDLCRQRRTDFFIAQRAILPASLPAGEYILKVSVEDKLGQKVNETNLSFQVIGPASLASGG